MFKEKLRKIVRFKKFNLFFFIALLLIPSLAIADEMTQKQADLDMISSALSALVLILLAGIYSIIARQPAREHVCCSNCKKKDEGHINGESIEK